MVLPDMPSYAALTVEQVGADGFNSPVRAYAGIESYGWAYDTTAVVATLSHHPRTPFQAPNTVAYQRFLPTGPIAFLPLSPTTSSMVWSTKPHLAKALLSSDPAVLTSMINAAFRLPDVSLRYLHNAILEAANSGAPLDAQQLQQEIAWRERSHGIDARSAYSLAADATGVPPADADSLPPLVTSIQPGTAASFPLRFSHADEYIGDRTVLVGDAAHTIHPLAGQGLNMGLGDVEALFRCVNQAVLTGGDIGKPYFVSTGGTLPNSRSPPQARARRSCPTPALATSRTTRSWLRATSCTSSTPPPPSRSSGRVPSAWRCSTSSTR